MFSYSNQNISYAEDVSKKDDIEQEFVENLDKILDDIDSNELDDFLTNDFNFEFLNVSTFKDLVVKVLNGTYFDEYDSFFQMLIDVFKNNCKDLLKFIFVILALVLLFEMFNNFCIDKYADFKKAIKIIFSFLILLILLSVFKNISFELSSMIEKIFSFSKIIFPVLLSLVLTSGAAGTYSVYSSLSLFLLNTGSYVFTFILLPLATSIFVLNIFGSALSNKKFSKLTDIFKSLFKYIIVIFFVLFGLFSSVNLITSGMKDGVSLRLTKFAIKNYIPIIGGYVSQGFDFVHSCSVVIKNAFGVCGIIVLLFLVLKPLILYFVYMLVFKLLSAVVSFVGNDFYADMFSNVSKTISYFVIILVGLFFIVFVFIYLLIFSVSVV